MKTIMLSALLFAAPAFAANDVKGFTCTSGSVTVKIERTQDQYQATLPQDSNGPRAITDGLSCQFSQKDARIFQCKTQRQDGYPNTLIYSALVEKTYLDGKRTQIEITFRLVDTGDDSFMIPTPRLFNSEDCKLQ